MGGERDEEFRRFVVAHRQELLRTARLLTGDQVHAEDLVETALLKTYRHWSRIPDDRLAFVRRMLVTTYTSPWRRFSAEQMLAGAPRRAADPEAERNEQVLAALGELTPLMRAVVVLRFYEDLPDAQTAELLSCPVGTVETEGSVAVARLRELLADLGSDEEAGRR